jgi:hypothetical protein
MGSGEDKLNSIASPCLLDLYLSNGHIVVFHFRWEENMLKLEHSIRSGYGDGKSELGPEPGGGDHMTRTWDNQAAACPFYFRISIQIAGLAFSSINW